MTRPAATPTRRAVSDPKPLGAAVASLLKRTGLDVRLAEQPAFDAFKRFVGEEVAKIARPVRVQRGVLDVEVRSAALLHELAHFRAREILARIRRDAPATTVRSIRFHPATTSA